MTERFTHEDYCKALRGFLEFGDQTFETAHQGVFSGEGWDARVLRALLEDLSAQGAKPHFTRTALHRCTFLNADCEREPEMCREHVRENARAVREKLLQEIVGPELERARNAGIAFGRATEAAAIAGAFCDLCRDCDFPYRVTPFIWRHKGGSLCLARPIHERAHAEAAKEQG